MSTYEGERADLYNSLCIVLVPEHAADPQTTELAHLNVMYFLNTPEVYKHLIALLDFPALHPNVIMTVTSSLSSHVTKNWSLFNLQVQLTLYNKLFEILIAYGQVLFDQAPLAINQVAKFVSVLIRQSWGEVKEFMTVSGYISELVEADPHFKYIGFELANEIFLDMSPGNDNVRANHKRNATLFRAEALPKIFNTLAAHLKIAFDEALPWPTRVSLTSKLLEALTNAMEFDCISSSKGDVSLVTVPDKATPHWTALQNSEMPKYLLAVFQMCFESHPSTSEKCLILLSLLASVERTYYVSESDRHAFLREVIQGCLQIVALPNLSSHSGIIYSLCKLVARLSLSRVIGDMAVYPETLSLISVLYEFTKTFFVALSLKDNSMVYLLHFWDGMVDVVHNFGDSAIQLKNSIAEVCQSYLNSLLMSTSMNIDETEQIDREAQLEVLTSISRIDYPSMVKWVCGRFKEATQGSLVDTSLLPKVTVLLQVLEAMLANTKTQRTVLAPKHRSNKQTDEHPVTAEELEAVAEMTALVFELFMSLSTRPQFQTPDLVKACLGFIHTFIRLYFNFGVQPIVVEGIHAPIARFLGLSSPNDVLTVVITNLVKSTSFLTNSELCLQSVELIELLLSNSRAFTKQPNSPQVIICGRLELDQQFTLSILQDFVRSQGSFLLSCTNIKARAYFHKIITTLFERVSSTQVQRPFNLNIAEILAPLEARFAQCESLDQASLVVLLNDYRGFISGIRKADNYTVVFSRYLDEGFAGFIVKVFENFSTSRVISKPLLALLCELSNGIEARISKHCKALAR